MKNDLEILCDEFNARFPDASAEFLFDWNGFGPGVKVGAIADIAGEEWACFEFFWEPTMKQLEFAREIALEAIERKRDEIGAA